MPGDTGLTRVVSDRTAARSIQQPERDPLSTALGHRRQAVPASPRTPEIQRINRHPGRLRLVFLWLDRVQCTDGGLVPGHYEHSALTQTG
jgi:hypothetical protein